MAVATASANPPSYSTSCLFTTTFPPIQAVLEATVPTAKFGVPVSPVAVVAVAALPVQLPELPVQLPVTVPVRFPVIVPAA